MLTWDLKVGKSFLQFCSYFIVRGNKFMQKSFSATHAKVANLVPHARRDESSVQILGLLRHFLALADDAVQGRAVSWTEFIVKFIYGYFIVTQHFIVFCRSGTECQWTLYCYLVLPVRDRPSFVLGTRGIVLPKLSFGHLSLLSEWCGGLRLNIWGGWMLVSSFENSWPGVTACLFLQKHLLRF